MFNVYCDLKLKNTRRTISYLIKNFSTQCYNLTLKSDNSLAIIHLLSKLLRKNNVNGLKIISNVSLVKKAYLKKLKKYYERLNNLVVLLDCPFLKNNKLNLLETSLLPIAVINGSSNGDFKNILFIKNNSEKELFDFYCALNKIPTLECKYTSCVGRSIFIGLNNITFCIKSGFKGATSPTTIENDILNDREFVDKLKPKIELRDKCKKACNYFGICKSGCLYDNGCDSENFKNITYPENWKESAIFKDIYLMRKIKNEE